MILVTTGTQLPFDRLIRAMDDIAAQIDIRVFAQTGPSRYVARHLECQAYLPPQEFEAKAKASSLIVSHAGIGTVLTAMRLGRPIILFPRENGEHRNDHQVATCNALRGRRGVHIARTEDELYDLVAKPLLVPAALVDSEAAIRTFSNNLEHSIARLFGGRS
jgi:UDP-N-acetylglucosamine transferase subunit ALG13